MVSLALILNLSIGFSSLTDRAPMQDADHDIPYPIKFEVYQSGWYYNPDYKFGHLFCKNGKPFKIRFQNKLMEVDPDCIRKDHEEPSWKLRTKSGDKVRMIFENIQDESLCRNNILEWSDGLGNPIRVTVNNKLVNLDYYPLHNSAKLTKSRQEQNVIINNPKPVNADLLMDISLFRTYSPKTHFSYVGGYRMTQGHDAIIFCNQLNYRGFAKPESCLLMDYYKSETKCKSFGQIRLQKVNTQRFDLRKIYGFSNFKSKMYYAKNHGVTFKEILEFVQDFWLKKPFGHRHNCNTFMNKFLLRFSDELGENNFLRMISWVSKYSGYKKSLKTDLSKNMQKVQELVQFTKSPMNKFMQRKRKLENEIQKLEGLQEMQAWKKLEEQKLKYLKEQMLKYVKEQKLKELEKQKQLISRPQDSNSNVPLF